MWKHFSDGTEEGVKLYIPHKIAKVKNGQPWITANIKKLMRKRDKTIKAKNNLAERHTRKIQNIET